MSRTNNLRQTVFEQLEIRQLLATVNLTDFGARPNDGASDIAAIQAAHSIADVSSIITMNAA